MSSCSVEMTSPVINNNSHEVIVASDDDGDGAEQGCRYAMQLVTLTTLPMVLHAAIQLELFEIIAKAGPGARLSAPQIVAQLPTNNPEAAAMVDRILHLLASHSVVTCSLADDDGKEGSRLRMYGLASVSKYFVRNEDGVSFGPTMSLFQDHVIIDSWYKLKDAVIEGGVPFDKVHGMHLYEYLGKNPRFSQVFNTAMYSHTAIVVKQILKSYKGFQNLKQVVDVGGGLGVTLNMITSKYPSIKGINFDLPHVLEHAPSYPGVEHVGGDMFDSVPGGDTIYMKSILHAWTDDDCSKLLKNCYRALPHDGKVIMVEEIHSEVPGTSAGSKSGGQFDLIMMSQSPAGKERTKQEFLALAKGAGFAGIRYDCYVCNFWVMEWFK